MSLLTRFDPDLGLDGCSFLNDDETVNQYIDFPLISRRNGDLSSFPLGRSQH